MPQEATEQFREWAILELMGHVRLAGVVTEEERFGVKMGRIDIPKPKNNPEEPDIFVTQYFGGSSVYRLTPCAEEIARHAASSCSAAPISRWDLRALTGPKQDEETAEDDYGAEDDDF